MNVMVMQFDLCAPIVPRSLATQVTKTLTMPLIKPMLAKISSLVTLVQETVITLKLMSWLLTRVKKALVKIPIFATAN